jgi:hypothetical protein
LFFTLRPFNPRLVFAGTYVPLNPMVLFATPSIIIIKSTKFGVSYDMQIVEFLWFLCVSFCCYLPCTLPHRLKKFSLVLVKSARKGTNNHSCLSWKFMHYRCEKVFSIETEKLQINFHVIFLFWERSSSKKGKESNSYNSWYYFFSFVMIKSFFLSILFVLLLSIEKENQKTLMIFHF